MKSLAPLLIVAATSATSYAITYNTNFDGFTDGPLQGQDGWVAQSQWQVASNEVVNNTSGAFIRAHNTGVLGSTAIGESMTITLDFTLSSYRTPSTDIAVFEEGIVTLDLTHQQGVQGFASGPFAGLFFDVGTGNLELRGEGGLTADTSASLSAADGFTSPSNWILSTTYTKTGSETWDYVASISGAGSANIAGTATGFTDIDTDSDGGGIAGGFQMRPSALSSGGVVTGPFQGVTVNSFSISVVPEPTTFPLLAGVLGLAAVAMRRRR
ncbi:MAG: PEP-CTERM sorting domain-containing protein [Verrucomicrobiota bacterium]